MGSLAELGRKYGNQTIQNQGVKEDFDEHMHDECDISEEKSIFTNEVTNETSIVDCNISLPKRMSWICINKIVREKDVSLLDCLSVIYTALSQTADTIALCVQKKVRGEIKLYLGVRDKDMYKDYVSKYVLHKSLSGTIPGISYTDDPPVLEKEKGKYISATIGVPSLKGEKKEKFVQGIERIINASFSIPNYTLLFIAENKDLDTCELEKNHLENMYSELTKLSETSFTTTDSSSNSSTVTRTEGSTTSIAKQNSSTSNNSRTTNQSSSDSVGDSNNTNLVVLGEGNSYNKTKTSGSSDTIGNSTTNGETNTSGTNNSEATAKGDTITSGSSEQTKQENKQIKNKLKEIDGLINKYNGTYSYGLWDYSAYFISDTKTSSLGLSCLYRGLIVGKENESEKIKTILWENDSQLNVLWKYLENIKNPLFNLGNNQVKFTSVVNSKDLSICMSLPQTSVPGILVKEIASFGRNITYSTMSERDTIKIGTIVHMGQNCKTEEVTLDENLLTSHTFVTGSTGCGKSNTLYTILDELLQKGKKMLIIEPAKGEYKNIFGNEEGFTVLGTNPNMNKLLHINPFSFPQGIHVEEHIDRLIDIFNACWPMYAAMPAVLKQSITNAYISCGWDMLKSTTEYEKVFPTFTDVVRELQLYMNSSEYSQDSKGDYKGALETRLTSLTNGIIGNVFSGETELDDLFNTNTIVDLSRVGSSETKSLIMGMLILKLTEFRMSENIGMNLPLRHLTVLEEAHNLLRNSSSSNSSEGTNVLGKSVEMIASAIAEMRTFGEGFIIADQSPSLLDRAVITNTNTKILMNLPNKADRDIACSSIGLNEQQANEVSRLHTGIGVIYQQGWEEPILCQINKYEKDNNAIPYKYQFEESEDINILTEIINNLYKCFAYGENPYKSELLELLNKTNIGGKNKRIFVDIINNTIDLNSDDCTRLFVSIVGNELIDKASKQKDIKQMNYVLRNGLVRYLGENKERIETYLNMYVKGCSLMNSAPFYETWLMETNKIK